MCVCVCVCVFTCDAYIKNSVCVCVCVCVLSQLTGRVDAFYLLLASKSVDLSAVTLHLTQSDSPSLFHYLSASSLLTPLVSSVLPLSRPLFLSLPHPLSD